MTTEAISETLTYDVFINDPPPQDGVLPNGQPKRLSPEASALISGSGDAVLTDPSMTTDQARASPRSTASCRRRSPMWSSTRKPPRTGRGQSTRS
jgi:hypothetical protein